jgi:hypothetical protein
MDSPRCILSLRRISWFLEIPRSIFIFIQNRLFCRVTRLLRPGHPTTYRTTLGRPAMCVGSPERNQKSVSTLFARDALAVLHATRLLRVAHAVTASRAIRPSPKTSQAPSSLSPPVQFLPLVSFPRPRAGRSPVCLCRRPRGRRSPASP